MTARHTAILIAVCCLAGGVSGYLFGGMEDFPDQTAVVTLESSAPVETQLFYDIGRGFNENDSIKKTVYQANVPVALRFDLSGPDLRGLRFDPSRSSAKIKIHGIVIQYGDRKPFAVPLDSLTASKDIESLHFDGNVLTVKMTDAAQDPILYLNRIGSVSGGTPLKMIIRILTGAAIFTGVAFLIVWVYRNSLNGDTGKIRGGLQRL